MKIHLETLQDFHDALNKAQDDIKELFIEDFTPEEMENYIEGIYDDMLLVMVTVRMKRDYSFSQNIIDAVGKDDYLFN